jgi:hypothetical protein
MLQQFIAFEREKYEQTQFHLFLSIPASSDPYLVRHQANVPPLYTWLLVRLREQQQPEPFQNIISL